MAVSFSNGFPRTCGQTHTHGMAQKVTRIINKQKIVSVFSSCDSLLYNATHKVNEVMVLKYACVLGTSHVNHMQTKLEVKDTHAHTHLNVVHVGSRMRWEYLSPTSDPELG